MLLDMESVKRIMLRIAEVMPLMVVRNSWQLAQQEKEHLHVQLVVVIGTSTKDKCKVQTHELSATLIHLILYMSIELINSFMRVFDMDSVQR
ncbi:mini zinc finger protein [Trifolium repens]|jgi:hypothetical protein|nr:mini zinc finger protein [Trifolium repens]